ncbi:MAG TPA: NlpC/P60 family protein [Halanaerobiales bacterium]|nr:NlpC/P60 family protein [Halanaerobiales bacterium]
MKKEKVKKIKKRVEAVVKQLVGIPYVHNGRSYQGVDCWGLIYLFFKELGCSLPEDDGRHIACNWYKSEPERYIIGLKTLGDEVDDFDKLRILDIPYFRLYRNIITHSGVMLSNSDVLHVLINKRVRIDSINRRFLKYNYAGAIRPSGIKPDDLES